MFRKLFPKYKKKLDGRYGKLLKILLENFEKYSLKNMKYSRVTALAPRAALLLLGGGTTCS